MSEKPVRPNSLPTNGAVAIKVSESYEQDLDCRSVYYQRPAGTQAPNPPKAAILFTNSIKVWSAIL
jgi:hypothetical protein